MLLRAPHRRRRKQDGKPALRPSPTARSFDEDPAYLLFHYPSTVAKEDRVIFSEGVLLAEVNVMFMNIGIENISSRQIAIRAETRSPARSQSTASIRRNATSLLMHTTPW